MNDPLQILKECILHKCSISLMSENGEVLTDANQNDISLQILAQFSFFKVSLQNSNVHIYPRSIMTRWKSKRGTGDLYTLDSIWYCYKEAKQNFTEYLALAKKISSIPECKPMPTVSLVDRKQILKYLSDDKTNTSSFLIDLKDYNLAEYTLPQWAMDQMKETLQKESSGSLPAISLEKLSKFEEPSQFQYSFLYGTKPLDSIVLRILKDTISAASQAILKPEAISRANNSDSVLDKISHTKKDVEQLAKKRLQNDTMPIIILPASVTSLISLYNVHDFLIENCWISPTDKRAQNPKKEQFIRLKRRMPDQSVRNYIAIDNPQKLTPEDWDRVVAVFAQGPIWQFKDWKWTSPVEIFANVKGFHLRFDDECPLDSNIKEWSVIVLKINKLKRHMDQSAAIEFWSAIDVFEKNKINK